MPQFINPRATQPFLLQICCRCLLSSSLALTHAPSLLAHNDAGLHTWDTYHPVEAYYDIKAPSDEPDDITQVHLEQCLIQDTMLMITMRYLHPSISLHQMIKVLAYITQQREGLCEHTFNKVYQPCTLPASKVVQARFYFDEVFSVLGLSQVDAETFFHRLENTKKLLRYSHNKDHTSYRVHLKKSSGALCFLSRYTSELINGGIFDFTPYLENIGLTRDSSE